MGFRVFTTPCFIFAEWGSICMAEFFDEVIKDVELYQTGSGTDTSEPVPEFNVHDDNTVDSLTVWSKDSYRLSESCSRRLCNFRT